MATKKKKVTTNELNMTTINIITPIGLELKRNSLIIGENTGRIYGIFKYPQKVDYGLIAGYQVLFYNGFNFVVCF